MQIIRVSERQTEKAFIQFPVRIYKNSPHWVRPMDQEIKNLFNPSKNSFFENGEAERWILINFRGSMIGRIAAFVDRSVAGEDRQPMGGIGFFDCIDHPKAAFALFDQCKDWLAKKGVTTMQGPVNLLDRTATWGLLTNGFSEDSLYGMPYHHAYYQSFFESYGFQLLNKQYSYVADLNEEFLSAAYKEKANRVLSNADYRVSPISKKDSENFAQNLMEVYNDAWQDQSNFLPMTFKMACELVQRLAPVIHEEMVLFAYYQDQPVGFFINLPEMNQVYKHMNGRMNLFGRMKYFFNKEKEKKIIALMMGVKKEHQGKGVEAALITSLFDYLKSPEINYKYVEVAGICDSNLKVLHIANKLHLKMSKVFHTYEYAIVAEQKEAIQVELNQHKVFIKVQQNR